MIVRLHEVLSRLDPSCDVAFSGGCVIDKVQIVLRSDSPTAGGAHHSVYTNSQCHQNEEEEPRAHEELEEGVQLQVDQPLATLQTMRRYRVQLRQLRPMRQQSQ